MDNETVKKPNPISSFVKKTLAESASWFSRGLGSCASLVLGFFMVNLAILVVLVSLSTGYSSGDSYKSEEVYRDYGGDDKIALVELSGVISEDRVSSDPISASFKSITPQNVEYSLEHARRDESVKAVIIHINSPGGSPVASDAIYQLIENFRLETKKPVVVLMGDVAASGGYYVSSASDFIVANPSTLTGSIGVILESYNLSGLYEKVGVKKEVFKTGEYKDILSDSREISPKEREMIQSIMEDAYELFIDKVAKGRSKSKETVEAFADGRIFSGTSALREGLIDGLGNIDEAIYHAARLSNISKYKVVKIRTASFLDEILYGLESSVQKLGFSISVGESATQKFRVLYKLP